MRKKEVKIGTCPDCGRENVELNLHGICKKCSQRKANMMNRKGFYIPYINLSEEEKQRSINISNGQKHYQKQQNCLEEFTKNHVQESNIVTSIKPKEINSDKSYFVSILREHECTIPEKNLQETLDVLLATDTLKDLFTTIVKNENQNAILNLEQALNVIENKLQHQWEYNGFKEEDDKKFKEFLIWRRKLKGAIFFWKKLYQTNTLNELQKAWNAYTQDPNEKVLMANDRINSTLKRYQITTESISTILNTRRPFTRVFYATTEEMAYDQFKKWMAERQLHEDPKKTVIREMQKNEI